MIEGEKPRGVNSEVASLETSNYFAPNTEEGDASPVSSLHYSSCGESEFDRYYSANSIMGPPSLCSSTGPFNDCADSEFGSLRSSFELTGDTADENFGVGPSSKLSNVNNSSFRVQRYVTDEGNIGDNGGLGILPENSYGSRGAILNRTGSKVENPGEVAIGNRNGNSSRSGAKPALGSSVYAEAEKKNLKPSRSYSESHFAGKEIDREEDETSSRYEHSEGEDSMYGADDDKEGISYLPRDAQYQAVTSSGNENPLLIGSSIAFGSDDWYDFELQTSGYALTPHALDMFQVQNGSENERNLLASVSDASIACQNASEADNGNNRAKTLVGDLQTPSGHVVPGESNCNVTPTGFLRAAEEVKFETVGNHVASELNEAASSCTLEPQNTREISMNCASSCYQAKILPNRMNFFYDSSMNDTEELVQNQLIEGDPSEGTNSCTQKGIQTTNIKEPVASYDAWMLENQETGTFSLHSEPHAIGSSHIYCGHESLDSGSGIYFPNQSVTGISTKHSIPDGNTEQLKSENLELNDSYDLVHDMAEVLLDSDDSHGPRFTETEKMFQPHLPLRDGGWAASTSSSDNSIPLALQPLRIGGVKVIGAKQKRGDVSLGERLVGVKEYTVYVIRVWNDDRQWQVERRYREFFTVYRRLKSLSADQGWDLPAPWLNVEKESRKLFGNASPKIVAERSVLIQECLQSVLDMEISSRLPSALLWFLSPRHKNSSLPLSSLASNPRFSERDSSGEKLSSLGKTISLVVEIHPHKSAKQLLEAQQYTCAGCHRYFDEGMTLMRDIVQAFGWGKPRLCEYTGQLFCSSCHTNETSVLPARVLHHWDFNQYPVSQLAKSYLDSIHEQPMLCVSAVNPFLFSKVPALYHVMCIRKKIGTMLAYIRCPFRVKINNAVGGRRYLLESNDFFALKDLVDLSKGAFAALPVIVETISKKIIEHITEHCLVCCDVGVPCNARQACSDPASLIFPFQEGEVDKCSFCELVYHKHCFKKMTKCTCGTRVMEDEPMAPTNVVDGDLSHAREQNETGSTSTQALGLIAGLFSRSKRDKRRMNHNTVVRMASLPSNDL